MLIIAQNSNNNNKKKPALKLRTHKLHKQYGKTPRSNLEDGTVIVKTAQVPRIRGEAKLPFHAKSGHWIFFFR